MAKKKEPGQKTKLDKQPIGLEFMRRLEEANRRPNRVRGSIYDVMFHKIMGDRNCAVDFMKAFFAHWAKDLDFDKLSVEPNEIYSRALGKRVADLIYSVPIRGSNDQKVEISIVVEHKAQSGAFDVDGHTIGNVVHYLVATTIEKRKENKNSPQSLAVIVYTGPDVNYDSPKWEEYFPLPEPFAQYRLQCEIPCVNVSKMVADGTLEKLALSSIVGKTCEALGHAGLGDLEEHLRHAPKTSNKGKRRNIPDERELFTALGMFVAIALSNRNKYLSPEEVGSLIDNIGGGEEMGKKVRSIFDVVREQGIEQGREEGIEEGVAKTYREIILKSLAAYPPAQSRRLRKTVGESNNTVFLKGAFDFIMTSKPESFDQIEAGINRVLAETL